MKQLAATIRQIPFLLLLSLLFLPVFFFSYMLIKSPVLSYMSVILTCCIAWSRGVVPALILCIFNLLVIDFTFTYQAPSIGMPPARDAVMGIFIHLVFISIAAFIGTLIRKLRAEVEERKRVEALLNEYGADLEQRVEERSQELEKVSLKLHQAEKMETLGHLAGGIAHDFKNHLTIILGYSNLLSRKLAVGTPESELLKHVITSSERASELTTNLMNFSRKERYKPQLLDLNEIVMQTVGLFSKSLFSSITINCITPPDISPILGGKTQIQNALLNLTLNSKDAIVTDGHITIKTGMFTVNEEYLNVHALSCSPGKYAGITVTDNGSGIAPEILPHIFEPFFTTKPEGIGTGMGLSTIKGMTRNHRGDVFAVSEPGKGASFTMLFPVPQPPIE